MRTAHSIVLVAYAAKDGTTEQIADAISETLRASGLTTEVSQVTEVRSVEDYDAVVLGSEVGSLGWRRAAVAFGRRHEGALKTRPVWLFSSDPVMHPTSVVGVPGRRVARLGSRIRARGHALFTGQFHDDPRGGGGTWSMPGDGPDGGRDFSAAREWARQVAKDLAGDRD